MSYFYSSSGLQEKCRRDFAASEPDNSGVKPTERRQSTHTPKKKQKTKTHSTSLQSLHTQPVIVRHPPTPQASNTDTKAGQPLQQPAHWFPNGLCPRLTCLSLRKRKIQKKKERRKRKSPSSPTILHVGQGEKRKRSRSCHGSWTEAGMHITPEESERERREGEMKSNYLVVPL